MVRFPTLAAIAAISIILVISVSGCTESAGQWSIILQGDQAMTINSSVYDSLANCNLTINEVNGVPLEIILYHYGLFPVTAVTIDGQKYDWRDEAYATDGYIPFLVLPDGSVYDGNHTRKVSQINVTTVEKPGHSSVELPHSIMFSLNNEGAEGLIKGNASQIIVYYVDALGYYRYENARANGTINNITALGEPVVATCVYPSVSRVNSRALVTGNPSNLSKGDFYVGIPDTATIFDRLQSEGKSAVWIGGVSAPVFLGDDIVYRPDANHDGSEYDEIAAEAVRQYLNGTNLIIVHFKDTDKKLHAFGPESKEAVNALKEADATIGRINAVLDPGTIVVVYADHGGHDIRTGGNHGTLTPEDMIVPVIVHRV